jgi:DNA-binding response OmpR family regulator
MAPEDAPAAAPARPRVLVIDDEPSIRKIIRLKLTQNGYDPVEARDGEDAWEKLDTVKPAMLILDIMMPKLDGIALLRRIRDSERWRGLPVIVLTAVRDVGDQQGAQALGAVAVLQKPFVFAEILEVVRKHAPPLQ